MRKAVRALMISILAATPAFPWQARLAEKQKTPQQLRAELDEMLKDRELLENLELLRNLEQIQLLEFLGTKKPEKAKLKPVAKPPVKGSDKHEAK